MLSREFYYNTHIMYYPRIGGQMFKEKKIAMHVELQFSDTCV